MIFPPPLQGGGQGEVERGKPLRNVLPHPNPPLAKGRGIEKETFMFNNSKKDIETLNKKIDLLTQKVDEIKNTYEAQVKVLRQQMAGLIVGLPASVSSVLSGLPYSEISKEQVPGFIQQTPHLLILDVRSDEGWNNGYIPNAKHIPANQVFVRLNELADKSRPILTICANGNTAVSIAQLLAKEGYRHVFNALGGMAGYTGEIVKPQLEASHAETILGEDRELIHQVIQVMDRDVRPGLKRDGGDLKIISVEEGIVKLKMVGACLGCGAQKRTVEDGIKTHLMKMIPQIKGVEDLS